MTFTILGFNINLLSVVIFLFSTMVFTEVVKQIFYWILKKMGKIDLYNKLTAPDHYLFPITLSWIFGVIIFHIIHLKFKAEKIDLSCYVQYAFWILMSNGGYMKLKPIVMNLVEMIKGKFGDKNEI